MVVLIIFIVICLAALGVFAWLVSLMLKAGKSMVKNKERLWEALAKKYNGQLGTVEEAESATPPVLRMVETGLRAIGTMTPEPVIKIAYENTEVWVSRNRFNHSVAPDSHVTMPYFFFASFIDTKSHPNATVWSEYLNPEETALPIIRKGVTKLEGNFGEKRRVNTEPQHEAAIREWLQPDLMRVIGQYPNLNIEVNGQRFYLFCTCSSILSEREYDAFTAGVFAFLKELID